MSKSTFAIIASFFVLVGGIIFCAAGAGSSKAMDGYAKIEIREGDNLWDLATALKDKHSLTQMEFVEWVGQENSLNSIVLKPGDTVYIPVKKDTLHKLDGTVVALEE
ncbi:LysM peptidoglycan-binding domain-containing protein [Bacillus mangrovi]|uniref:LysM peptidoglycan-binding domain-containing protein n=1 Tax=Metabacillus mangrovi TaxID=1491830 RepID=A0A7X2V365_9BACI|nr:LysM peptidoglycan-binding domain-containing protein [Metabacillus mangrovi]MTH51824.1 LysM peptidoglycan-binding domain-containing protein [Metabacillus mangrovi]